MSKVKNRIKKMNFLNQSRTELVYVESFKGDKYMCEFKPKIKELRHHSDEIFSRTTRGAQRSQYI